MMFLLLNYAMPWLIHERDINIDERDINIEIDIEFNDGCTSQYKCVWGIQSFARRNVSSIRVYFEISHGKSKSDSLGGVVKDMQAERLLLLIQLYETQLNCISFAMRNWQY